MKSPSLPEPHMTYEQIGDRLGIGAERAKQICEGALRKLRRGSNRVALKAILEAAAEPRYGVMR